MPKRVNPFAIDSTGFMFRANGRLLPVIDRAQFTAKDLGLPDGTIPAAIIAEVVRNPSDPKVCGLKNSTNTKWNVTLTAGQTREVEPGKSIKLAAGTRIVMGKATVVIE